MTKIIALYTGTNSGFKKYLAYRTSRPVAVTLGFREILSNVMKAVN